MLKMVVGETSLGGQIFIALVMPRQSKLNGSFVLFFSETLPNIHLNFNVSKWD